MAETDASAPSTTKVLKKLFHDGLDKTSNREKECTDPAEIGGLNELDRSRPYLTRATLPD